MQMPTHDFLACVYITWAMTNVVSILDWKNYWSITHDLYYCDLKLVVGTTSCGHYKSCLDLDMQAHDESSCLRYK